MREAPGPRGQPILGSLRERLRDPLGHFTRGMLEYGDVVKFKMAYWRSYLVSHPDGIRHILQESRKIYVKGIGYDKLAPLVGKGLLTSEGDFWLRQRRLAQPAFHHQRLVGFAETMVRSTLEMLEEWEAPAPEGQKHQKYKTLDVAHEMSRLTLTIVGRTLFGSDVREASQVVRESLAVLLPFFNRRMLSIVDIKGRLPFPSTLEARRALQALDRIVQSLIEQRRKEGNPDKGDLLSMLMLAQDAETGERMNDLQLRDEIKTIFLAGHETTASVLAWTFYLLSKHPDWSRRVGEEIREALGDRPPAFADVARLSLTDQVIQESMRLYPPIWFFTRQALEDDEVLGYSIPKRSIAVISPYVVHRRPDLWPNPEGFDPGRFTVEAEAGRHKFAYIPFGGGPRVCIGNAFAQMEATLVAATVLQRYRLDLVPGQAIRPEPLITLRPAPGIQVRLIR